MLRPRSHGRQRRALRAVGLAGALLTCSALTGDTGQRERAEAALAASGLLASRDPRFAGWALAVAEAAVAGPLQVAVVGPGPDDAEAAELLAVARRSTSPGLVVAHGRPTSPATPCWPQRPLVGGRAAAYVCRGFVCDAPVTDAEALAAALGVPLR